MRKQRSPAFLVDEIQSIWMGELLRLLTLQEGNND